MDTSVPIALNAVTAIHPGKAPTQRDAGDLAFFAGMASGHRLHATVQNRLSNGEFLVMLGAFGGKNGQEVQMKLPPGFRQGDVLNLIFVSREPRPTFMVATDASQSGGYPALLSETGRFIHDLIQRPPLPGIQTTLSGAVPLLAAPPVNTAELLQLAQSLARVIGRSGLFYESHQVQWVSGMRSLAELLLEPQARLAGLAQLPIASPDSAGSLTHNDPANQRTPLNSSPVHPDALALIRQQLDVYETRHIAWQGELWPGQRLAWEAVEEKPEESKEGEFASGPAWKTRLYLSLPNLGPITASLRLDPGGIEVQLTVKEPETASIIRTGAAPLMRGLESAGLKLVSMRVHVDGQTSSA